MKVIGDISMDSLSALITTFGSLIGAIGGIISIWTLVSTRKRENKMWRIYFRMLPDLRDGKTWDPKIAEEIKLAEQMVEKGILERSPMQGYRLPDVSEDFFSSGANLR